MVTIDQLSEEKREALFNTALRPHAHGAGARRREFLQRYKIATDDYDDLISARIGATHHNGEVVAEQSRWAVGFFNIQKRVGRKLAVAYKRRPIRRLEGEGVTDEDNAKLTRLYERLHFNARALRWQRLAVQMNRIIVVAVVREDENGERVIDFDVLTGAETEVHSAGNRPLASVPDVAVQLLAHRFGANEPALRVIDSNGLRFYNEQKLEIPALRVEQQIGTFPGADMLSEHAELGSDWWDWKSWSPNTKATIEAGMIYASAGWTRKTQCRKLLACTTSGERDDVVDGSDLVDHERPLMLNGPNIALASHDLDTPVEGFRKHVAWLVDECAEQMTGTASTFADPDPSLPNAGVGGVQQHAAIEEVRESQCPPLERFERRMAYVIMLLAQMLNDPDAVDPELVRKSFKVQFQRLPFLDTPEARVKVYGERTKFGISNQVQALVEEEGISEAEAEERLMHLAEQRVKLDAFRASRQQPGDPFADPALAGTTAMPLAAAPGETLEQTQGRAGGSFDDAGNPTMPPSAAGDLAAPGASAAVPAPGAPKAAAALAAQGGTVADAALNGTQQKAITDAALLVTEGKLPAEFLVRFIPLAMPTISDEEARRLVEPLIGFEARPDPVVAVKPPASQANPGPTQADPVASNDSKG
ncbi:MAG: hypothetical protein IPH07_24355 [Deltaproteobacteria bacterium]|nr:hypothetical protein [Deltaproteobacteria bacterium]